MSKQKSMWVCGECGFSQAKWSGSCSSCSEWNTFVEELLVTAKTQTTSRVKAVPTLIKDVAIETFKRQTTGIGELDRLLGGGIVDGSLILFGGEPGIGKSTLMMQIADSLAKRGAKVLYVCGEESAAQTALRAKRLGVTTDNLYLYSEILFDHVLTQIDKMKPDILIVDSIQIVYKSGLSSTPGSVTQVREIASECMQIAKGQGITTFLVGHVTKSGSIAGPRVLEHLVDGVFEFEGDKQQGYRMLRSIKNRFGATDDIAMFQMGEQGLKEVPNPSAIFMEERIEGSAGSVIIPTVEGARSLLTEVQALVAPSSFATASRRCTGLDAKRLSLLLAVLEKRMGYQLHSLDVFVSVAGGMKITEPAVDLGVIVAIASSFINRAIDPNTVIIGEVGLGGEVRSVGRCESRLKEAIHMGFKKAIIPQKNLSEIPKAMRDKIECLGITRVDQAINATLKGN